MEEYAMEDNIGQQHLSGNVCQLDSIHAYIFVHTCGGNLLQILEKTKNLKHVISAAAVSGDYTIIVKVRVQTLDQLMKTTDKLQLIQGIHQTATHIIEKEVFL
jgi:DNA-binding Lrp family transcriptional regulator